jgi:hypothetical protein
MAISIIQGQLTHVQHASETHGQINKGSGHIASNHVWSFRVNGRAAAFKSSDSASLSDGDLVTVAGEDNNGTFSVYALRNDTTGALHNAPATVYLVLGAFMIVIGVPLIIILAGLLLAPYGIYLLRFGKKMRSANNELASMAIQKAD